MDAPEPISMPTGRNNQRRSSHRSRRKPIPPQTRMPPRSVPVMDHAVPMPLQPSPRPPAMGARSIAAAPRGRQRGEVAVSGGRWPFLSTFVNRFTSRGTRGPNSGTRVDAAEDLVPTARLFGRRQLPVRVEAGDVGWEHELACRDLAQPGSPDGV